MMEKIVIVGGGLSGLYLANLVQEAAKEVVVLEAADRLGGRIHTIQGVEATPMELGATWFSDMHPRLLALLGKLELEKFPQFSAGISLFQTKSFEPPQKFYIPESEAPSYRIAGGTGALITKLASQLPATAIQMNQRVKEIHDAEKGLEIVTGTGDHFSADKVILCIPPQLAGVSIQFSPELPESLATVLPSVQTWMAGAIKFTIEYTAPFWREAGYSGMLYSHAGIVMEMYDHTNFEATRFGFTGFLNGGAVNYPIAVRKELVLQQLVLLLGEKAGDVLSYLDKIWTDDLLVSGNTAAQRPHQNNGHPLLQAGYLKNRLFFCNTETATEFGGYMEGAVRAVEALFSSVFSH
jgi:monoamine oxidase